MRQSSLGSGTIQGIILYSGDLEGHGTVRPRAHTYTRLFVWTGPSGPVDRRRTSFRRSCDWPAVSGRPGEGGSRAEGPGQDPDGCGGKGEAPGVRSEGEEGQTFTGRGSWRTGVFLRRRADRFRVVRPVSRSRRESSRLVDALRVRTYGSGGRRSKPIGT